MTVRFLINWMAMALVLFGSNAAAQTIEVQSGEHATFSRLVFADVPGRTWETNQKGNIFQITFSTGAPELSLERVFDLIPRDRLQQMTFAKGTLLLELACPCPVTITQIPSNHIVIDIRDPSQDIATENQAVDPPPGIVLPVRLPLVQIPGPFLTMLRLQEAPAPVPVAIEPTPTVDIGTLQIRRHPMGSLTLLSGDAVQEKQTSLTASCKIDALARRVLSADPEAILAKMTAARFKILDGGDALEAKSVHELAVNYLKLGWGAEAMMTAAASPPGHEMIATIAAALDGFEGPADTVVDPGCGPGAAVLALLAVGGPLKDWGRADEPEVTILLASLPTVKWNTLEPRLRIALRALGRESLLTGLEPPSKSDPPAELLVSAAARADMTAVVATTGLLVVSNDAGMVADSLHIANAQALRPSVPSGSESDALDSALLESLVIANMPEDAIRMVAAGRAEPDQLFKHAMEHLTAENAAETIVRLRPLLASQDPVRLQARDLFLSLGLKETARRFADLPSELTPLEVRIPLTEEEPWLARDFATLTAASEENWTPRNRIAAEIVARNAAEMPETDLAAAESVLTQAQSISVLVRDLVDAP